MLGLQEADDHFGTLGLFCVLTKGPSSLELAVLVLATRKQSGVDRRTPRIRSVRILQGKPLLGSSLCEMIFDT